MSDSTQVTTDNSGAILVHPRPMPGRPPGMGRALQVDPRKSAVVVVDAQRFFLETPPFSAMQRIIDPLEQFIDVARSAGMKIVYVNTIFSSGMSNAGRAGSRTRQMMESVGGLPDGEGRLTLMEGSRSAELPDRLATRGDDRVVTKNTFSGFAGTELDSVLKEAGVETLLFAGGTTTVCVESTLRDAVFLGYNPLLLSDCTADMTPDLHESALHRIDMFFGWVCDAKALMQEMSAAVR